MSESIPTLRYQVWQSSGEGFYFKEYASLQEIMDAAQGGEFNGRWFVTECVRVCLIEKHGA